MKTILSELKTSIILTLVFVFLFCGVYPLAVWAGGQALFPDKANGSLIVDKSGAVRGSRLLAQSFISDKFFWPRPSAAGTGYDATSSGGTNLGPTSDKLANGVHKKDASGKDLNDPDNFDGIKDLVAAYRTAHGLKDTDAVPADAVTRSASGLDPHISVANAKFQAARVATARGISLTAVHQLIAKHTEGPDLGILGEPGVNVLTLNLELDGK
ncbi:MAG TPA: K(+)-transporting ATPase subunit C [Opitutaceae bacterium]|nr:K(+)-transporting ATPase subunit C [Opitutaceae bacterium]